MEYTRKIQFSFFLVSIALSAVLLFFIFKPFLSAVFFAATLTIIFYPLHDKILFWLKGRETLASLISVFFVIFVILLPIVFITIALFRETASLYVYVTAPNTLERLNELVFFLGDFIGGLLPRFVDVSEYFNVREYVAQGLSWIIDNVSVLFSGFVKGFLNLFLMILALFYFFKDGRKLKESFIALSPLSAEYDKKVLDRVGNAINSVVKGRLLIGIIQGFVISMGFMVFSVPNPILWGTIAAVFSVLPAVGPMFIVIPAAAYLYFSAGSLVATLGIIIWGIAAILLLDEYLGSILIDKGMKIHPFLILLSILGGLAIFGPVGFLLGPASLSLFFALLEIYPLIIKKEGL